MDVVHYRRLLVAFALLLTHHSSAALPVLLEVYYDAPGSDSADAFTEIAGTAGFSLAGYSLVGINGSTGAAYRNIALDGAIIPADGILVLATASASGDTLSARDWVASVDWQNGPDAVALLDPAGLVVDALQYGTLGGFAVGEGAPAIDVAAGNSLSRDSAATDTGDNAADFGAAPPTPGTGLALSVARPPRASVAEPTSLLLALATLVLVACGWRTRDVPQSAKADSARRAVDNHANGYPSCTFQSAPTKTPLVALCREAARPRSTAGRMP